MRKKVVWLFNAVVLLALGCQETPEQVGKPAPVYVDPPHVRTYPTSAGEIQGWIDRGELAKIRQHGWDIWESITSSVKHSTHQPVWETWYSGHEIFDLVHRQDSLKKTSTVAFEGPIQFHRGAAGAAKIDAHIPVDLPQRAIGFNRYTESVASYIWDNKLNLLDTLLAINARFDKNNTPIAEREMSTSKDTVDEKSIVLKVVFQFISGDSATAVPYWAGISPQTTTNLDNPEPHTWRQAVAVDPTGKLPAGSTVNMAFNDEPAQPLKVVSLDDFYYIRLTKEQADSFTKYAEESGDDLGRHNLTDPRDLKAMVKEGNVALMMAIHATTKEIRKWTWQTFWWDMNPNDPQYGADRPKTIKSPWNRFNMRTAYFMTSPADDPKGTAFIGFNPYLETNLTDVAQISNGDSVRWSGVHSNCMSCHRLAALKADTTDRFGISSPPYWPDGYIDKGDSTFFAGRVKLDFLWSLTRAAIHF